jgi:predicted nucleic acid-binding protein
VIRDAQNQIYVSRLIIPESFGVIGRMWRAGQLNQVERDDTANFLLRLLRHRRVHVRAVTTAICDSSGQLSLTLATPQYPQFVLRALDAIQLATALSVRQTSPQIAFVCADQRLIALAQSAGMAAVDPATQP